MALLTDELDNWDPPGWVLDSRDPLWQNIKNSLIYYSLDKRAGMFCYGIIRDNEDDVKPVDCRIMHITPVFNDRNDPDINLTTSFVYHKLKAIYPDKTVVALS